MAVNAVQLYVPGQVPNDPTHDDGDFERRRREARARLAEAMKGRPIQHWTQGLHQMAESALAGYDEYKSRQDAKEQRAAMADIMSRMYGGGQGGQGSGSVGGSVGPNIPAAAMKPPEPPAPTPNTGPIPNDIAQSYGIPGATFDAPGRGQPTEYPAPPPPVASSGGQDPMYDEGMQAYEAMLAQPPAPQAEPSGPPPETQGYNAMGDFMPPPPGPQSAAPPPKPPMPQQMASDNSPMIARMSEILARDQQPLPQQAPPQIAQRMVQSQPIPQPQAPAPGMDPGRVSAMAPPPPQQDMAARVPHPGMMGPPPMQQEAPAPRPQGMMGLGAQLPPVDGVTVSRPPGVSTEAPPPGADLKPLDIRDLTGGATRGPGGVRDPSGIQRIIAHDVAGNITPENLARYSQQNKGYHYAVDRNTGQVYQLQKPEALAYHAKGGNSDSLGVAMTGFEGQPTSPQALASMNQLLTKLGADYKIPPERMLTHPGVQQGKNAKEADWLPAALAYKQQQGGAATAAAPPAADPSKAQGLIQMAQSGPGMTPELFRELALRNPQMAQQLMMQDIQRRQAEPDKALNREHQTLQNQMLRKQLDQGNAPAIKETNNGKLITVDPRTGAVKEIYDGGQKLTSTDKKAVYEAQDELPAIDSTIQSLRRAEELVPDVYSGFGAGVQGFVGSKILGTETGKKSAEFDQIMSMEAIQSMSKNLKGATTDKEMKEFQRIISDPSQPAEVKSAAIGRILRQAEMHRQVKMDRIQEMGGQMPGAGQRRAPPADRPPPQGQPDPWAGAFPGTGLPEGFKIRRLN